MKVFVPMSDEILESQAPARGRLVPFNPEFLESRAERVEKDRKPANWIVESDYTEACQRLREDQLERSVSHA
jgi:hypothetical protein